MPTATRLHPSNPTRQVDGAVHAPLPFVSVVIGPLNAGTAGDDHHLIVVKDKRRHAVAAKDPVLGTHVPFLVGLRRWGDRKCESGDDRDGPPCSE